MSIFEEIQAERDRQKKLGYTREHDQEHGIPHLTDYAIRYARLAGHLGRPLERAERRTRLIQAAALIVAAIELHDGPAL